MDFFEPPKETPTGPAFTLDELRHLKTNMHEWVSPNCDVCMTILMKIDLQIKALEEAGAEAG